MLAVLTSFSFFASQASAYNNQDRREIKAVAMASMRAALHHDWATVCRLSTPYGQTGAVREYSKAYHKHFASCTQAVNWFWAHSSKSTKDMIKNLARHDLKYIAAGAIGFDRSKFEENKNMAAAQLRYNGSDYKYFSLINGHWRQGTQPHGIFTG